MTQWNHFSDHEKALIQALFTARSNLTAAVAESDPLPHFSFQALYEQVERRNAPLNQALQQALLKDRKLRESFHHLLKKQAHYYMPRTAAASSGSLTLREIEGFRIRLKTSRVESSQLYIIIELPEGFSFAPTILMIYEEDGHCQKLSLPAPIEGKIQLLTETDSPLAEGVRNHKTELFLR